MIILISAIILLGIVTYYFHRLDLKKQVEKTNKIFQTKIQEPPQECFGRHLVCERDSLLAGVSKTIEYYDPAAPDISLFIGRASNAFLPKLVYQLEEYGLPRMISRKIQDSGLINLEDDTKEISEIIIQFKTISPKNLISNLKDIMPFDKFIIQYFYEGIS